MADAGAYTVEQLHDFKINGRSNLELIKGKFEWLRHKLLVVLGGCFYYETLIVLEIRKLPVIWLRRDENGYLLLNLKMLTTSHEERLSLQDNFWITKGNPSDFECPPSGKLIQAKYLNGDEIRIEFFELSSVEDIHKRYMYSRPADWNISFPVTAVEVQARVGGTNLSFGPNWSMLPGNNLIVGGFFSHAKCGISIS